MSYILHVPILVVLLYYFNLRYRNEPLGPYFIIALIVKIAAGVGLGLLYLYYYKINGDTFSLFISAKSINNVFLENPTDYFKILWSDTLGSDFSKYNILFSREPRALFAAKLISFIVWISFNNYWISGAYLSLLSGLALWNLANYLSKKFPGTKWVAILSFLFFPSVIFWSSGVIKESLLVFFLFFSIYFFLKSHDQGKISVFWIIFWLISGLVLWQIKFYYIAVIFPLIISYLLARNMVKRYHLSPLGYWGVLILILIIGLAMVSLIHPILHPDYFLEALYKNYQRTISRSSVNSLIIQFNAFQPEWGSFFQNVPQACFAGIYLPLIGNVRHVFQIMAGIENSTLLLLTFLAIYQAIKRKQWKEVHPYVSILILYVMIMSALLAFASPNLGTLIRYKVGYIPFYMYLLGSIIKKG